MKMDEVHTTPRLTQLDLEIMSTFTPFELQLHVLFGNSILFPYECLEKKTIGFAANGSETEVSEPAMVWKEYNKSMYFSWYGMRSYAWLLKYSEAIE